MLEAWTAGAAVLRGPLVVAACVGCFVLGAVAATHDTPAPAPTPVTVATVTDADVARLVEALDRFTAQTATTGTAPAVAQSTVTEAEEALDTVAGVTPAPTTTAPTSTTSSSTTTTTTSPPTSIASGWVDPPPTTIPPSSTVPPPFTVTVTAP